MLAHVVGECWHAFHRDVLTLPGRDLESLSLAEMVSVVVGAPPGSAVRHWLDDGWTRTDHLLANQQELHYGTATMAEPYPRPGVAQRVEDPTSNARFFPAEVITWDEAERRDKERYAKAGKAKPGATRVRTI